MSQLAPRTCSAAQASLGPAARRLAPARRPAPRVVELPAGSSHTLRFRAPSDKEENSAVLLLFPAGQLERRPRAGAALGLLAQMVREPCFTELRTRQQLGYVVSAHEASLGGGQGGSVRAFALSVLSKTTAGCPLWHSPLLV